MVHFVRAAYKRRPYSQYAIRLKMACVLPFIISMTLFAGRVPAQEIPSPTIKWTADWSVSRFQPGFPLLEDVAHFTVQPPSIEAGAYQHHPQLSVFKGRFYAAWSAHRSGEDGPGQRVLFSHSSDGIRWETPVELFPPLDDVKPSTQPGRVLTALRFVETQGKLFAIAEVHDNVGFTKAGRSITSAPMSSVRTDQFSQLARKGLGRLVRDATETKNLGQIHWLNKDKPDAIEGFENYPHATVDRLPEVESIRAKLNSVLGQPTWDFKNDTTELLAPDGTVLLEPTTYKTANQGYVRLWRALNDSFCMYGQLSSDGVTWSLPTKTPVPDAPAKTVTCRLPSGEVLLIGNQVFNKRGTRRDPLTMAVSKNGYHFDRAFAIRWRTPKFRIAAQQRLDGRGTGFQYPSVAIDNNNLWVIHSVNKEAIDVSTIPIDSILNFSPCSFDSAQCIAQVIKDSPERYRNIVFDKDAVLKGSVSRMLLDGSCRLKMVWQLRKGRRPIRFIHICSADGEILRQSNRNRQLFNLVTDEKLVLDNVLLSAAELEGAEFIAVGFYDPKRKSSPITKPDGTVVYRLPLFQLNKKLPAKPTRGRHAK